MHATVQQRGPCSAVVAVGFIAPDDPDNAITAQANVTRRAVCRLGACVLAIQCLIGLIEANWANEAPRFPVRSLWG